MDTAAERELRELQARAYGRDAAAMDAAAARRLRELEALRNTPIAPAAPAAPAESLPPAKPAVAADPVSSGAGDVESGRPRRDARSMRHRAMWWAASVVGAAAVAAIVTFILSSTSPVSASSGAPQIDTLPLESASDRIPQEWFGARDDTIAADFLGFTVFTIPGWSVPSDSESADPNCIAVVETAQIPPVDGFDQYDWTYGGDFYSGCGVGAFPATVEVPINSGAPEEMLERHPSAEALQFVLDGDRVGVFLDDGTD